MAYLGCVCNGPVRRRSASLLLAALLCFTAAVAQPYRKVVSLSQSLSHCIVSLGLADRIAGCTTFCDLPEGSAAVRVATAITVNTEKIWLLQPDVVVATTLTPPDILRGLRKLGLNVVTYPTPASFREVCNQYIDLGNILGAGETARETVIREEKRITELRANIPKTDKPLRLFFQIGADPVFTVLAGTFMEDYITLAGGTNISAGLKHGIVSRESVLAGNPDAIIITTMGGIGEKEKETWMSYPGLAAARSGRILIVDADQACSPAPDNFTETLRQIIEFLYPARQ